MPRQEGSWLATTPTSTPSHGQVAYSRKGGAPVSELPFSRPGKVIAVGLNYREHASEANVGVSQWPVTFAKFTSCLIGPGEPIRIPKGLVSVDYEAELAVIIGREAYDVSVEDALDYVAGYTCLNDVTD